MASCQHSPPQPGCPVCDVYLAAAARAIPPAVSAAAPKPPGLLRQALNFGTAVVKHVATGMKQSVPEEKARRLALCVVCAHYRPSDKRCSKCGCLVDWKAGWAGQHCTMTPPKW